MQPLLKFGIQSWRRISIKVRNVHVIQVRGLLKAMQAIPNQGSDGPCTDAPRGQTKAANRPQRSHQLLRGFDEVA